MKSEKHQFDKLIILFDGSGDIKFFLLLFSAHFFFFFAHHDAYDGKSKHLGYFTRARDAAMAYDEATVELSGRSMDELILNFPDGMSH